jgi:thiamine-monophosphate kinase
MLLGRTRAATACMDLSDGLADAVRQVAAASRVGIAIDGSALPIADGVRAWHGATGGDVISAALQGGDDYELLFTVRGRRHGRLRDARRHMRGLQVTRIGEVTKEQTITIRTSEGIRPLPDGFEHFR